MKKHDKKTIAIIVAVAVVLCGVSFYSGMKYSQNQVSSRFADRAGQFGGMNGVMNGTQRGLKSGGGAGFISGEIISKDDTGITVKDRDGGSKIIFISGTTEIMKSTTGTIEDLSSGITVIANGKTNTDGSITATSIQIRPAGTQGFGGPGMMPSTPKQ